MPSLSTASVIVFALSSGLIDTVTSQQRLGVAIGNNDNGNNFVNPDVFRREHYEYNHAPEGARQGRRAGPFDGVIPGLFFTIASSALQWWNEGRAVRDARMLADAKRHAVQLDADAPIDTQNDGKLIHITGFISTESGLADPEHGLYRPDALQLIKTCEAYQWKEQRSETRTRVGERETKVEVEYRYFKEWSKRHIDSNQFQSPPGHYNPHTRYQLGRNKMTVNDARISSNGLLLGQDLVDQIGNRRNILSFTSDRYVNHGPTPVMLGNGKDLAYNDDAIIVSSKNMLYFSQNHKPLDLLALEGPSNKLSRISPDENRIAAIRSMPPPEVGDIRVSWDEVTAPPNGVSILAMQKGDKLVPWVHGDKGHKIYTLFPGQFTAESMIEEHIQKNKFITKILRIGGWVGSFFGLNLVLSCIPALIRLLPFGTGHLLAPLAQIATSTIAMSASLGLSAAVIAVAWLRFRPLLATGLLFVSSAGFLGPLFYARWNRSPEVKVIDEGLSMDEIDELAHLT